MTGWRLYPTTKKDNGAFPVVLRPCVAHPAQGSPGNLRPIGALEQSAYAQRHGRIARTVRLLIVMAEPEQSFLHHRERALGSAALRARPIVRQLLEGGAGIDAVVGVADGGIVDPTADVSFVLSHKVLLGRGAWGAAFRVSREAAPTAGGYCTQAAPGSMPHRVAVTARSSFCKMPPHMPLRLAAAPSETVAAFSI